MLRRRRSIGSAERVIVLEKPRVVLFVLLAVLLICSNALARDYIELWPEGWSDTAPLFTTSIFADRFFAVHDEFGTSFLSVDGTYFKELNLTYRSLADGLSAEEIVLRAQAEIDSVFLGLDGEGGRHVVWLEKSPEGSSISCTVLGVPYSSHEVVPVLVTSSIIQDLAGWQEGPITHVVWSQREPYYQIRYAQIRNGEVILVETVTDTEDLSVRPAVTVDSRGAVHLAWMEVSQTGVEIRWSRRMDDQWSAPRRVGEGSVQDIQQGGLIAVAAFGTEVHLAWSALPRNSSRQHVFLSSIAEDGEPVAPRTLAPGTKPRFVQGTKGPELVWQGVGPFGAEIHYFPYDGERINLTVGRRGAFRPEAYAVGEYRYVYWLHVNPDGGYDVYGINNQFPKAISLWRRMGIDEHAPFYHLAFLVINTMMLTVVYTAGNIGVMAVAGAAYGLLQKFGKYRRQPLFYQITLLAALAMVARRLPIPALHPQFFGVLHHGLCFAAATLGSFLVLRRVRERGMFFVIGTLVVWMLFFQFFALIPQNILQ
ncbi:MAG TPA: hypothetical protein GX014_07840 [Firmicutes bacterium]|jgi:hypothetical protein|nr:hypothetical protein [Bacillota bacterium]HHT43294.1 hypothetical protein [Bacillota bacterium]